MDIKRWGQINDGLVRVPCVSLGMLSAADYQMKGGQNSIDPYYVTLQEAQKRQHWFRRSQVFPSDGRSTFMVLRWLLQPQTPNVHLTLIYEGPYLRMREENCSQKPPS